jgi:hypothetical protein
VSLELFSHLTQMVAQKMKKRMGWKVHEDPELEKV